MRKPKQRWARLTEAEQRLVEDLSEIWPHDLGPTKASPDGSRWGLAGRLAAYRATHTSQSEQP